MCGISGIFFSDNKQVAPDLAALALFGEQHRGQESCGVAWSDGQRLHYHNGMGLVKEVFNPARLEKLKGPAAIGHVRYPTQGGSTLINAQPHLIETLSGPHYALASNGDLINYQVLAEELRGRGIFLKSTNDGEVIARLLVSAMERDRLDVVDAVRLVMSRLQGAFSTVFLLPDRMVAFRDPWGFRPMMMGKLDGGWAVTSESCALDVLRATEIREVAPGEILVFDREGVQSFQSDVTSLREPVHTGEAHCVFELIYFARPDSFQYGKRVYETRREIGKVLATYDDFVPDVVVPVPDSSNFIAQGYAQQSGAPFEFGLIRNHYVGRTFIKPLQTFRDESVKQKFNPLSGFFDGKSVVLVDDSIVRGTTLRKIVRMIRRAGAREVHVRIGSPEVRYPCFYGIDTPTREELIANQMSVEEIRDHLGATSLRYLRIEDLRRVMANDQDFCFACFDEAYPVGVPPRKEPAGHCS